MKRLIRYSVMILCALLLCAAPADAQKRGHKKPVKTTKTTKSKKKSSSGTSTANLAQAAKEGLELSQSLKRKQAKSGLWGFVKEGETSWAIPPVFEDSEYSNFNHAGFCTGTKQKGKRMYVNSFGGRIFTDNTWPKDEIFISAYDIWLDKGFFTVDVIGEDDYFSDLNGNKISREYTDIDPNIDSYKENCVVKTTYNTYNLVDFVDFKPLLSSDLDWIQERDLTGIDYKKAYYYLFRKGDNYGIMTVVGKQTVEPIYKDLNYLDSEGMKNATKEDVPYECSYWFCVAQKPDTKKWGVIDLLGNEILEFKYKNENSAIKNFNKAYKKGWKELVTTKREETKRRIVGVFEQDMAAIEARNKKAAESRTKKLSDKRLANKMPHIRTAGRKKYLSDDLGDLAGPFDDIQRKGNAYITKNAGKYGLISLYGIELAPNKYTTFEQWTTDADNNSTYMVALNGKYGKINTVGKFLRDLNNSEEEFMRLEANSGNEKAKKRYEKILASKPKSRPVASANKTQQTSRKSTASTSTRTTTTRKPQQSSRQQQQSAHIVRQWTEHTMGGKMEHIEYSNGGHQKIAYVVCPSCRGTLSCASCSGTGACSICHGQGGMVTAMGNWLPCSLCGGTGVCSLCKGQRVCVCTTSKTPGWSYVNQVYIGPNGAFTDAPPSGSSSSSSSDRKRSGSRSSVSDRYGYIDCHLCHGTGRCSSCNGTGVQSSGGSSYSCPNCLGHYTDKIEDYGLCNKCNGTGKVYGIK